MRIASFVCLSMAMVASTQSSVALAQESSNTKVSKLGIIGLDTSHAPAFTKEFNSPKAGSKLGEMKVVAASQVAAMILNQAIVAWQASRKM